MNDSATMQLNDPISVSLPGVQITSRISFHEMLRRFALGELNSMFSTYDGVSEREKLRQMLTSGDYEKERAAIQRSMAGRDAYVRSIPSRTEWFEAQLSLDDQVFKRLYSIFTAGWKAYTSGTFKLVDAANRAAAHPDYDNRVTGITAALRAGTVELTGITLWTQSDKDRYVSAEGTGRLISLYNVFVAPRRPFPKGNSVTVVVGLSRESWVCGQTLFLG